MGGRIAIGVLAEDGTLKTITAWTNPLPSAIKNEDFATFREFSAFNHYIDYYENKSGDDQYGPSAHVPCGYGYVLVDFKNRKIIGAQEYTGLHSISDYEIRSAGKSGDTGLADGKTRLVSHIRVWNESEGNWEHEPVKFNGLTEMNVFLAQRTKRSPLPLEHFTIAYPDWEVVDGKWKADAILAVRDHLISQVDLLPEEIEIWDAYMKYVDDPENTDCPDTDSVNHLRLNLSPSAPTSEAQDVNQRRP